MLIHNSESLKFLFQKYIVSAWELMSTRYSLDFINSKICKTYFYKVSCTNLMCITYWSHLAPLTRGRQMHWPVCLSQPPWMAPPTSQPQSMTLNIKIQALAIRYCRLFVYQQVLESEKFILHPYPQILLCIWSHNRVGKNHLSMSKNKLRKYDRKKPAEFCSLKMKISW